MEQGLPLSFIKMHGLGNDFVVLDLRASPSGDRMLADRPAHLRLLCDRRFGVGCDQVIGLAPANLGDAQARMIVYNADGSDGGMCGNGARCIGDLLLTQSGQATLALEAAGRLVTVKRAEAGLIAVDMGRPGLDWRDIPLARPCDTLALDTDFGLGKLLLCPPLAVSMGNPHLVLVVADSDDIDVAALGPRLEHDPLFPKRTNVEFVSVREDGGLRLRVWERGSGMTLACGTGACATLVAVVRAGKIKGRSARILMDGGEASVAWDDKDDHVWLTGPAAEVFAGRLPDGFWQTRQESGRAGNKDEASWPTARAI